VTATPARSDDPGAQAVTADMGGGAGASASASRTAGPDRHWPSVGVVIPTRDRPVLLAEAVAGVLAQDYPGQLRIVVVYDRTAVDHRLAGTVDRPVTVRENRRTAGLAGARNTGIEALDTELIAFCDDDDVWAPAKLTRQVSALAARPGSAFATCAVEVEYADRITPRLAGRSLVGVDDLVRSRMAMLHSSTFLARRHFLTDPAAGIGGVCEHAPGSQNEDWDLLLRAAKRAPIVHVDEPLVRVRWGRGSAFAFEFATKMASLRWMMGRHPEIKRCRPGAARVYGQLACWSAATGRRRDAWHWANLAVRSNCFEPRVAIALAAVTGMISVENVLTALHKHGRGI
jgi:glycosyltransferase involved in cell wall biosynthesis